MLDVDHLSVIVSREAESCNGACTVSERGVKGCVSSRKLVNIKARRVMRPIVPEEGLLAKAFCDAVEDKGRRTSWKTAVSFAKDGPRKSTHGDILEETVLGILRLARERRQS